MYILLFSQMEHIHVNGTYIKEQNISSTREASPSQTEIFVFHWLNQVFFRYPEWT